MKIQFLIFFLLSLLANAWSNEPNIKCTASWEDLNKPYGVVMELQKKQILFAKPNTIIKLTIVGLLDQILINEKNKPYPYTLKNDLITLTLPDENKILDVELTFKNKEQLTFKILTAILDSDTNDGIIKYNGETYVIGKYPVIPATGKVNYFKESYKPPQYFFIWNEKFEELPISKNMIYADLVIKPDAEPPQTTRPPRPTKVFTLSYETLLNFDIIIEKSRVKTPFKKVTVLSYYRTPDYNKKIEGSSFSRHIYGDGIDWFIDENPENDEMDDLNKDGKVSQEDALIFVQTIIECVSNREIEPCGTGVYFTKKGASLHYDSRGHLARWGASDQWWPDKDLPDWLKEIENKVKEKEQQKKQGND